MSTAPVAERLTVETEASGEFQSLLLRFDDHRTVLLHSRRNPLEEAGRLVAPLFSAGDPDLVIVVGLGLGYVLDAIERRSDVTKVLAFEVCPATIGPMRARRDWSDWVNTGRLTHLVGPDYEGVAEAWKLMKTGAEPPGLLVSAVFERETPAEVRRARDLVERVFQDARRNAETGTRANAEARLRFAGVYLLNTIRNLPVIAAEGEVSELFGAFAGTPAVVVGAGPSLDKDLEVLSGLQERVLVVAVDTAVRPLLAAGIRPHLVVAVDPQECNARHLCDLPDTEGMWLVAESSITPETFDQFCGRCFIFRVSDHQPWPWLTEHGADHARLQTWGSVLTSTFDLACRMGCDPVVFVGADLAFTDGVFYCRNTIYESEWAPTADRVEYWGLC